MYSAAFLWTLQRFDTLPIIPNASLLSPKFYADCFKAAEFCFTIQAGPFPSTSDNVGDLFLCRCDNDGPETVEVEYEVTFSKSGDISKDRRTFLRPRHGYESTYVGSIKKDHMSPEELCLSCAIMSFGDGRKDISQVGHDYDDLLHLSQEFKQLYETSLFSDVVIQIQNKEFNVHRAVLDARCPGLIQECQEIQSRETHARCDQDTIHELLYSIYTGVFQGESVPDDLYFFLKKCNDSFFNHLCLPFVNLMHAHTSFKLNTISLDWIIENFFNFSGNMEFCSKIMDNDPSTWFKIKLLTVQHSVFNRMENLKFMMYNMCEETVAFVLCTIFVIDAHVHSTVIYRGSHLFSDGRPLEVTLDDKISIIRSKLNDEGVMFKIEIVLTDGVPVNSMKRTKNSTEIAGRSDIIKLYKFGRDIGKLCANSQHSDAILKINNNRISVHKAILSARSPVFREIFQGNTFETKPPEVVINDLEEKVALSMIHYIYSAHVIDFDTDLAFKLYIAAKIYEIPQLKRKCRRHIISSLNGTNVGEILIFADAQKDNELVHNVMEFINSNPNTVLASEY